MQSEMAIYIQSALIQDEYYIFEQTQCILQNGIRKISLRNIIVYMYCISIRITHYNIFDTIPNKKELTITNNALS